MACTITYNNKEFTPEEFNQYIISNPEEFINYIAPESNTYFSIKDPVEKIIDGFNLNFVKIDSVREGFATKDNKQNKSLVDRINNWINGKESFRGIKAVLNPYNLIQFYDIENKRFFSNQDSLESTPASSETIRKVREFIKRIGVDIETLSKNEAIQFTRAQGIEKGYIGGVADLLQKMIWITEGKENVALPEEAMHFAVEIIEQTNPKLYTEMYNKIGSLKIYESLLNSGYAKEYRTSDGKLDVKKLKKEAIGKVLAEYIVKINDGAEQEANPDSVESPSNIQMIQYWWNRILEWLTSLFKTADFNPFEEVATQVLEGTFEGTVEDIDSKEQFFSLEPTEKQTLVYDNIIEQDKLVRKEDDKYYVNDVEIKNIVEKYKSKNDREDKRPEELIEKDKIVSENARLDTLDILHRYINDNGFSREEPLAKENISMISASNQNYYRNLENGIAGLLETVPQGTRFLIDKNIYDAGSDTRAAMVGNVDLIAILPDGTVDLYDFSFMNLSANAKDIPFQMRESANIRISAYKGMLKRTTNITDFRRTRSLPVILSYGKYKDKFVLKNVEIKTPKSKRTVLNPIIPQQERTGIKLLDQFLDRLQALYTDIKETSIHEGRKDIKREQLNKIAKSISEIQMSGTINEALSYLDILNAETDLFIENHKHLLAPNVDKNSFTNQELSNYASRVLELQDKYKTFRNLSDLKRFFNDKETIDKIREVSDKVKDKIFEIDEFSADFVDKFIGDKNNIQGLLVAEKELRGIASWFRSPSRSLTRAISAFYRLQSPAFNKAEIEIQQEYNTLQTLRDNYMTWAKNKGLSEKDMFNLILKKNDRGTYTNNRIDTIQKEFFSQFWNSIKSKDQKWISSNIDIDKYKEWAEIQKENKLDQLKDIRWDADDEVNSAKLKAEVSKLNAKYDISSKTSQGWFNPSIRYFAKPEWYTTEYKELIKPENRPALDFWNYMEKQINQAAEFGVIDQNIKRVFTPLVYKYNMAEKMVFGKSMLRPAIDSFIDNVTINNDDLSYGYIDPSTGEIKNRLPFRFTSKKEGISDDLLSSQLFENMLLFNNELIRYKNLTQIEDQIKLLQRLEHAKQSIKTNRFGRIPGGRIEYNDSNEANAKLLDDMISGILYQQRYTTSFEVSLGTFGANAEKNAKAINKFLGSEVIPENLAGKSISGVKLWEGVGNLFRAKVMGLNVMIPTVNLIGGNMQTLISSGNWFSSKDYGNAEWRYATRNFSGEKGKIYASLLDYMVPLIHNYNKERLENLSVNKLANASMSDILFKVQEKTDQLLQGPIALAMIENSIIVDGKILNARKVVKDKYRKELVSATNKREVKSKIEKEIQSLIKEKGIVNLARIENDKLKIEGIELDSVEFAKLRSKIQNITKESTGAMTEDDRAKYTMTILGRSFMTFKNWIPPLLEKRVSGLTYKTGLEEWQIGRITAFTNVLINNPLGIINNLINITTGNEKGVALMDQLLQKKKDRYFQENGINLEITPEVYYEVMQDAIKGFMRDIAFYLALTALYLLLVNIPPEDEDKLAKGWWKFYVRMSDKLLDEIRFYYNPVSIQEIANGSVIPAFGVFSDIAKLFNSLKNQSIGYITDDEEQMEKATPLKYAMKSLPATNQLNYYLAVLSPEYAKEMRINLPLESRINR